MTIIRLNSILILFLLLIIESCGQNESKQKKVTLPVQDTLNTIKRGNEKLDLSNYEVLTTDHNATVQNFYVLIKGIEIAKDSLQDFVSKFRQEFCSLQCNIWLYDNKAISSLVTKYPLSDKEYLSVADHFVASSSFDMTDVWLYPFQDIKYKELGGKNWKKPQIK